MGAGWRKSLAWFSMTSTIHHQEMTVTYTCMRNRMKPHVKGAWDSHG